MASAVTNWFHFRKFISTSSKLAEDCSYGGEGNEGETVEERREEQERREGQGIEGIRGRGRKGGWEREKARETEREVVS